MVRLAITAPTSAVFFGCILQLTFSKDLANESNTCSGDACTNEKDNGLFIFRQWSFVCKKLVLTLLASNITSQESDEEFIWGPWGSWSECSVTCGTGQRIRSRRCYHMTWPVPSKVDTQLCKQDAFDEKDCDMPHCKDNKAEKPHTYQEGSTDGTAGGADDHVTQDTHHHDDRHACNQGENDDAQYSADGISGPDAMSGAEDDYQQQNEQSSKISIEDEAAKLSGDEPGCRPGRSYQEDGQEQREDNKEDTRQQDRQEDEQGRRGGDENQRSREDGGQYSGPDADDDAGNDEAQTADDDQDDGNDTRDKRRKRQMQEDEEIEEEEEEDRDEEDEKNKKKKKRKRRRRKSRDEKSSSSSSSEDTSSYCTDSETESEEDTAEDDVEVLNQERCPVIDLQRKQSAQLSGYEEDRESGDEIGELESPMVKFTDGQVPILSQSPAPTNNHQPAFIPPTDTDTSKLPASQYLVNKATYQLPHKSTSEYLPSPTQTPTQKPSFDLPPLPMEKPLTLKLDLSSKAGGLHKNIDGAGSIASGKTSSSSSDGAASRYTQDVNIYKKCDSSNFTDRPDKSDKNAIVKTSPSSESDHSGLNRIRCTNDSGDEGDISDGELSEDQFGSNEKLLTRQGTLLSDLDNDDASGVISTNM